ncbi:putative F-box/LRR-repeat protein 23 [Rosa rugosa]|uniref:putative F-box/LRR-repeat protein 23 n=1 Tax=Rosa rugosa TaxID=74645 RepID=UPI002B4015BE|nr:putative F-box/LRR-repeat protein 23 [Rosa rugosa]
MDILETAQKMCAKWYKTCKDPIMWRIIDMGNDYYMDFRNCWPLYWYSLCKSAIGRCCGNLVDINIENFGTNSLLCCLAERSSGLKRLRLVGCHEITDEGFRAVALRFPLLEDLDITLDEDILHETLALVGRTCPLLKSLKLNKLFGDYQNIPEHNDCALAIAGTMHGLHHLMLFRNQMSNEGLCAILDGCPHLESLDLRRCLNLTLEGDVGRRCVERIQKLRLPLDSIEDIDPSYNVDN